MRKWSAPWLLATALAIVTVPATPDGSRHASFVPWKVLNPADAPPPAPLAVYWLPSTREELRRSELLVSDELTSFAELCVAMRVIRPDDYVRIDHFAPAEKLPLVLLVDEHGQPLERAAPRLDDVEEMVRDAVNERSAAAEQMLDEAREKAAAGERDEAIEMYRKVWEQRCLCPRQGRDAARALKKLKAQ